MTRHILAALIIAALCAHALHTAWQVSRKVFGL